MTSQIARHCPQCKRYQILDIRNTDKLKCPRCHDEWGIINLSADTLERCPICQCRQFYISKQFNQFFGCLIVGIGILLVPVTYGLSLPVFALIDWLIYRRVPTMIICYKCGSEFHHWQTSRSFKPFMHHIGLKYDKYR